jgi:hypothetical protein
VMIRTPFQPLTRAMLTSQFFLYLKLYFPHLWWFQGMYLVIDWKFFSVLSFIGWPLTLPWWSGRLFQLLTMSLVSRLFNIYNE